MSLKYAIDILSLVFLPLSAACDGSTESESCGDDNACDNGLSWQACCTASDCRYLMSDGTEFLCDGTDCTNVSGDVAAACVAD